MNISENNRQYQKVSVSIKKRLKLENIRKK